MPEKCETFQILHRVIKYLYGWVFLLTHRLLELHSDRMRENGHKLKHGKFWYEKLFAFWHFLEFLFVCSFFQIAWCWSNTGTGSQGAPSSEIFRIQLQPWATWPDQNCSEQGVGLDELWRSLLWSAGIFRKVFSYNYIRTDRNMHT